jgi:hypothetical protein
MEWLAYLIAALAVACPIYLACWKGRFWVAVFATWALLVGKQAFHVLIVNPLASDITEIGLTVF